MLALFDWVSERPLVDTVLAIFGLFWACFCFFWRGKSP